MTTGVRVSFFAGWRLKIYSIQEEIKSSVHDSRGTKGVGRREERVARKNFPIILIGWRSARVDLNDRRISHEAAQDLEYRLLRDEIGRIKRRRIRRQERVAIVTWTSN